MSSVHARPILIMAGGTGGHVFPALALARLLRARSYEVIWLGTQRGLEARVVPADRLPIEFLSVARSITQLRPIPIFGGRCRSVGGSVS